MTRYINPMEDFRPIFNAIKGKLAIYATIRRELRLNGKLKPGETMEARIAERAARLQQIQAAASVMGRIRIPTYQYCWLDPVSALLTAHRVLRGKPANHGVKEEDAQLVTDYVVTHLRKELADIVAGAEAAGLV